MTALELKLKYVCNVPPTWGNVEMNIPEIRIQEFEKIIKNLKGSSLFIQGNFPIFFKLLLKEVPYNKIQGIDFISAFQDRFEKDKSSIVFKNNSCVIIYNVGEEAVMNYNFSGKVLKGFLLQARDRGNSVIVVSNKSYTEISKIYDISFINTLRIPYGRSRKIC